MSMEVGEGSNETKKLKTREIQEKGAYNILHSFNKSRIPNHFTPSKPIY